MKSVLRVELIWDSNGDEVISSYQEYLTFLVTACLTSPELVQALWKELTILNYSI